MFPLNRTKWIWIGIILGVVLIVFSVFRYQAVNKPFQNYSITEIPVQQNESIVINDAIYNFAAPIITEEDDRILYEVPLTINNRGTEKIVMDYENFILYSSNRVQNGVGLDEVSRHPDNQDSPLMNGAMPDTEGSITLVFQMQKKWNVEVDTKMDLYYVYIRGEKVEKYRLPLNY